MNTVTKPRAPRAVQVNPRPSYFSTVCCIPETGTEVRGVREVYEFIPGNGRSVLICVIANRGNVLDELCKRGIPRDDARLLRDEFELAREIEEEFAE